MTKMLENGRTILWCHDGTALLYVLSLLTQRQITAAVAGCYHFSENRQGNLWRTPPTEVQANGDTDTPQRCFRHTVFA
jgi:hypothetical protein